MHDTPICLDGANKLFPSFFLRCFLLFSLLFLSLHGSRIFCARHHRCLRLRTVAADAVSAIAATRYIASIHTGNVLRRSICFIVCALCGWCYSRLKHSIYLFHCVRFVCVQSLCSTCHCRCHYCRWRNRCERTKGYSFTSSFSRSLVISNALKRTESFFFLLLHLLHSCLASSLGFCLVLCAVCVSNVSK